MLFLEIGLVFIILFVGLLGSFFPILPGPIISFFGFVFLHFGTRFEFESPIFSIGIALLFTIIVSLADFFLQIFGVKKMGGGKNAMWGVTIGAFIGLVFSFSIISLILGPVIGGFIGSLLDLRLELKKSKKTTILLKSFGVSLGAFFGFFLGVCVKFLFSFIIFLVSIFHILNYIDF